MTQPMVSRTPVSPKVNELVDLAVRGLDKMYDPDRRLFCHKMQRTENGVKRVGTSHRYTLMCLLGLVRAREAGVEHGYNIQDLVEGLLRDLSWLDNSGDTGLLMWLCALCGEKQLVQLQAALDCWGGLKLHEDVRAGRTMETAWLLTGLAYAAATSPKRLQEFSEPAMKAYAILRGNRGKSGLFGHTARRSSIAGAIRGHVGSFADQVYPIVALSVFGQVFGCEEACRDAVTCARQLCDRQGPEGQWWWHYHSKSGQAVERYPVYSVHQHGMGPMALLALPQGSSDEFMPFVERSLSWLHGNSDSVGDMTDPTHGVIWRNVHQKPAAKWMTRFHLQSRSREGRNLQVLYECWSYELGWLLYALAPQAGPCGAAGRVAEA